MGALGHTELLRSIEFEARFANTLVAITTGTVVASDRTRWHTLSTGIQDVVRIAGAGVGSHTESVVTWFVADRIAFLEVVLVLDVSVTTDVDQTERGMGLEGKSLLVFIHCLVC